MHNKSVAQNKDNILLEIEKFIPDMIKIRQDFHQNPELSLQEFETSNKVATLLQQYGFTVTRNIGKTGLVGTLKCGSSTKSIGFRADMDALPIEEQTNLSYASKNKGVMHACGHDGHTTILLTAARYLAQTKNFDGTVHVIFQPAEEGYFGAKSMIDDGLFEKFPCDKIFGLHNWPGFEAGTLRFTKGPMMASVDTVHVKIIGKGGHGARPEITIDPIVVASSIVMALQSIVSRNVPPLSSAIVTVGMFQAGSASNIIPEEVKMAITVRAFSKEIRKKLEERICTIIKHQAKSYGAEADIYYEHLYPMTVNNADETDYAKNIAKRLIGSENVVDDAEPLTPSEDFSYMLEKVKGAFIIMGNGDSAGLHTSHYNFNDDTLTIGASLWSALAEEYLKK